MVKYLFSLVCLFLILSSPAIAKDDNTHDKLVLKIQNEFGRDLVHAPFFLRFSYYKHFGKDWGETDYPEREAFLIDYEINLAADKARYKAEAQAELAQEKEDLMEKKTEELEKKNRLKAQLAEQKAEEKEAKDRQKEMDEIVKEQRKELAEEKKEFEEEKEAESQSENH